MSNVLWWIRQSILALAACFFILFGIHLLIFAYSLKDPFVFIMTFFSSNLIILISCTLLFIFVCKMIAFRKKSAEKE